jgi:hypothetical protein
MSNTQPNEIFKLAADLVNYTDKHVFLTGKAGTGKTTFLKYIRDHTHKNTAVVAPTGVAAINAGGTTLHSLLQLPFGVFIPEGLRPFQQETREEIHDRQSLTRRLRISGNKRKVIEALELLIIDEISMVRADLLDMVDTVLRHVRRRPQVPFGGVQLLYIGDMFQLPPVLREGDRELLNGYYKSPFFFDSKVIQQAPPVYVELTHVYRQSDPTFINVLNQVRNNLLDDDGLGLLQKRYMPGFKPAKGENYITLATHNYMADQINIDELNALPARVFEYHASVQDDFPETAYPVDKTLRLKLGAQVMFIKNDLETPRRYFNGKIGVITDMDTDTIMVQCADDKFPIKVPRETWKNIRYTYEANTRAVNEEELGSFTQYPLRLAWAITIHKSQGLTFEKAIIDAGKAFEAGQVYVALSRCTSLDGMVLLSPIHKGLVMTHERIAIFGRKERSEGDLQLKTMEAKKLYLYKQLLQVFHFSDANLKVVALQQQFQQFSDMFNAGAAEWLNQLQEMLLQLHHETLPLLEKLNPLLEQAEDFETDQALQSFFVEQAPLVFSKVQDKVWVHWKKIPGLQTGNTRKSAEAFFTEVEAMNEWLKERIIKLTRLKDGFTVSHFFGRKISADHPHMIHPEKQNEKQAGIYTVKNENGQFPDQDGEIPHIELYRMLRKLTNAIVDREDVPAYMVANSEILRELCKWLPLTPADLQCIKGFGVKKVEWIGDEFLEEIMAYCEANGLESNMGAYSAQAKRPGKEKQGEKPRLTKSTSVEATLALWKELKTIEEVAKARNFSPNTIAGHLAMAMEGGELDVNDFLSNEKRGAIDLLLPDDLTGVFMTPIKEQLGDSFSYNDIKFAIAHKRWLKQKP